MQAHPTSVAPTASKREPQINKGKLAAAKPALRPGRTHYAAGGGLPCSQTSLDPSSKVGTFTPAPFDEAKKNDWTVISMKNELQANLRIRMSPKRAMPYSNPSIDTLAVVISVGHRISVRPFATATFCLPLTE